MEKYTGLQIYWMTVVLSMPFCLMAWISLYKKYRVKVGTNIILPWLLSCIFYPALLPVMWLQLLVMNLSRLFR